MIVQKKRGTLYRKYKNISVESWPLLQKFEHLLKDSVSDTVLV